MGNRRQGPTLDLGAARAEVSRKSAAQVERETSAKWAARALACLEKYRSTGKVSWLIRAENDRSEALEHAGHVGDFGRTVGVVQRRIDRLWKKARR